MKFKNTVVKDSPVIKDNPIKSEGLDRTTVPMTPISAPPAAPKKKSLWEAIPAWGYVVLVLAVVVVSVAIGAFIVAH